MIESADYPFYLSVGAVCLIGFWLLIRPIVTWYYKYDRMIENQEEIITLLRQLVKNTTPPKEERK